MCMYSYIDVFIYIYIYLKAPDKGWGKGFEEIRCVKKMPQAQIDLGALFRGQVLKVADDKPKPLGRPRKIKHEPEEVQVEIEEDADCVDVKVSISFFYEF